MGIQYREPTPSAKWIGSEDAGINTFHMEIKYKKIVIVKFEAPRRQLHIRTEFSVTWTGVRLLRTPTYLSTLGYCNPFKVAQVIQLRPAYINPNKNHLLHAVACLHLNEVYYDRVDQLCCMSPRDVASTALATPLDIRIRRGMNKHM